jgi:hypothetical protein
MRNQRPLLSHPPTPPTTHTHTRPQILAVCCHPGVVRTELGRYLIDDIPKPVLVPLALSAYYFTKSPKQGAQTQVRSPCGYPGRGCAPRYLRLVRDWALCGGTLCYSRLRVRVGWVLTRAFLDYTPDFPLGES